MRTRKMAKDDWEIIPRKTALVVIDMQRAFMDPGAPVVFHGARELVPGINELADICRRQGMPVVFVGMTGKADLSDLGLRREMRPVQTENELEALEGRRGTEFCDGLRVLPVDHTVYKLRYSAFIPGSSDIEARLRRLGRDRFIVCGILTDVCLATTTMDAMMLGFRVFVASDLTTTVTKERKRLALRVMGRYFARVMDVAQIRAALQTAGA